MVVLAAVVKEENQEAGETLEVRFPHPRRLMVRLSLRRYAGPGGWNDPCLLLSQDWSGKMIMTELQIRAQFSMWAVVSAPLLISGSVTRMTAQTLEVGRTLYLTSNCVIIHLELRCD